MTTITLTDPDRATQAGTWAMDNIGYHLWDMSVEHVFTKHPCYKFCFDRKQDAVLFSLKWL